MAFLKLGVISFGGPIAHLGYFHAEFVTRRRWLTDEGYADLVALCQFLPGPASSQVAFALGMRRAGLTGAILASICFLLPSAVIMIAFAYGVGALGNLQDAGWLHGLKLAAVAVVAQAVWTMARKLCPDLVRLLIAIIAAACVIMLPGAWSQVGVIAAGAIAAGVLLKLPSDAPSPPALEDGRPRRRIGASAALLTCAGLLAGLPLLAHFTGLRDIAVFDSFYRSGALVFGGGHVVLPLLREELVPRGWISDDSFLAGYAAAQGVPGPLFSFAGYLGAVMYAGPRAWLGGTFCLLAIFLPAWLLVGGAMPFWESLRRRTWARLALHGANAAVVGVLLAALYSPVGTEAIREAEDVLIAAAAFALLQFVRMPPIFVVALCAAAGQFV